MDNSSSNSFPPKYFICSWHFSQKIKTSPLFPVLPPDRMAIGKYFLWIFLCIPYKGMEGSILVRGHHSPKGMIFYMIGNVKYVTLLLII